MFSPSIPLCSLTARAPTGDWRSQPVILHGCFANSMHMIGSATYMNDNGFATNGNLLRCNWMDWESMPLLTMLQSNWKKTYLRSQMLHTILRYILSQLHLPRCSSAFPLRRTTRLRTLAQLRHGQCFVAYSPLLAQTTRSSTSL